MIANLPASFFSRWPTALSVYDRRVSFFFDAMARKVSMWHEAREATKASSGSMFAASPLYSGVAEALTTRLLSKVQVWLRV